MEKILTQINERYLAKTKENEKRKSILSEFNKLRESKEVKRYIELSKIIDEISVLDDEYLLNMTFNKKKENVLFDCNIYVYYGAYMNNGSNIYMDGTLTFNWQCSDFLLYKNLLDFSDMNQVLYYDPFYNKDKVIIKFNDYKFNKREDYEYAYNKLRAFYCKCLLEGKSELEILEMIDKVKDQFNIIFIGYGDEPRGNVRRRTK